MITYFIKLNDANVANIVFCISPQHRVLVCCIKLFKLSTCTWVWESTTSTPKPRFSPTQVLDAGLNTVSIPPCCIHQQALTISWHAHRQALLQPAVLAAVATGSVYQAVLLTGAGVSCIALLTPPEEALEENKRGGRGVTQTPCYLISHLWVEDYFGGEKSTQLNSMPRSHFWSIYFNVSVAIFIQLPDWLDNNTSVQVPCFYSNHQQNVALPQCVRQTGGVFG